MIARLARARAWPALALVALVLANGYALRAELSAWPDLNDSVLHYTLAARVVQAVDRGESPLDFWVSEWTLGYPVPRTYQPLGHLVVAMVYLALGRAVPLAEVFIWTRFLLVCLLPLTAYAAARLLRLGRAAALGAALLSPLIATSGLYGLEYGSYLWRGSGLYAQAWAMHGLLLTLGLAYRAVRSGRGLVTAAAAMALTFSAHFIYGYVAALSTVLLLLVRDRAAPDRRLLRVATIGLLALVLAAWVVVPLLADVHLIGPGRWEPRWKVDSYGAGEVAKLLLSGRLLDFGRLPVLSLLALVGGLVSFRGWRRQEGDDTRESAAPGSASAFLLLGAALWLLLLCGRPTWGPTLAFVGLGPDVQLHRLIGGVHVFLLLLAAVGLAWFWDRVAALVPLLLRAVGLAGLGDRAPRLRDATARSVAVLASLLLLFPALRERHEYLVVNARWAAENAAANRDEQDAVEAALQLARERGGRVYPGLARGWGNTFRVGSVPMHALVSIHHLPAVAFLYHGMALTSDLMVRFDERNPAHYRLFNVATVLADRGQALPPFLSPVAEFGRLRLYAAPAVGYFDLVSVPYGVRCNRQSFYDVNDPWLQSDWVAKRQHLLLDFGAGAPAGLASLSLEEPRPPVEDAGALGRLDDETRDGEAYRVRAQVERDSFLLFKMTYHPNWRAFVDGRSEPTVMLSPGFVGVRVSPGRHDVEMRYEPGSRRAVLLVLGAILLGLAGLAERRGWPVGIEERLSSALTRIRDWSGLGDLERRRRWLTGLALVLLALPVCAPFLTTKLPAGHDAMAHFPRLVEFHESIRHGILLPRWAPDLSSGFGQPFFLFYPPLAYDLGEVWHLLGWDFVTALNLAAITLILASGVTMFLLANHFFGRLAGIIAAAAYLYAPYFHVNLFVRSSLAESAALVFFPLTLYGLARLAQGGGPRSLVVGAAGYGAVLYSHHPAALLFSPLLLAFLALSAWQTRSLTVLKRQIGALLLGLGLAASFWLPALIERRYISVEAAREGYYGYANHFVYPRQLVDSPWGYGLSVAGSGDGMSFSLGWAHLLLALLASMLAFRVTRRVERRWQRFFAAAALGLCVLMLPSSAWLWGHFELLQYVQFPWRLLGPVALCLALVIAPMGAMLPPATGSRRLAFASVVCLLVIANVGHARPERYIAIDLRDWTPEEIAKRDVSVTSGELFRPRWVHSRAPYRAERIRVIDGDAVIEGLSLTPTRWQARVTARQDSTLELSLAFYPGWRAWLSGKEAPLEPEPESGLIRLRVPAGEHRLDVRFTRTGVRLAADSLSLLSAIALGLLFLRRRAAPAALGPAR